MAEVTFLQTSFLGGQWSATAQGRMDKPEYKTALSVCFNSLPLEEGAWTRRPGTQYAAHTKAGSPARLVAYAFQQQNPYTVELTTGYIRFYVDGASLATTNDAQAIAFISSANPAVVETVGAHGWTTGNTVVFTGLSGTDSLLLNRQFVITVVAGTTFSIVDALTSTTIDGSTFAFTQGSVARVLEYTTVYGGTTWQSVRLLQQDTNAILLQKSLAPQVLSVVNPPGGPAGANATFSLGSVDFVDGPYLDPPTNGALVVPSALVGNISATISFAAYSATQAYTLGAFVISSSVVYTSIIDNNVGNTPVSSPSAWTAVPAYTAISTTGFTTADIGRHIRFFSEPPLWIAGTSYTSAATTVVKYTNAYWVCTGNNTASNLNAPGVLAATTYWGPLAEGAQMTWGKITSIANVINTSGAVVESDMSQASNAFNSVTGQTAANSAYASGSASAGASQVTAYLTCWDGLYFSGGQAIGGVQIAGSADQGLFFGEAVRGSGQAAELTILEMTVSLYGSMTSLSNPATGVLLGSYVFPNVATGAETANGGFGVTTILSNDTVTAYKYLYVVFASTGQTNWGVATTLYCYLDTYAAQISFLAAGSVATGGNAVDVEILGPPLLYTTPIVDWRLGLFQPGSSTGWPSCGTFHEGRLWLSGAVPNRIDGSQPNQAWGNSVNFGPTNLDYVATVTDANAIDYIFNSETTNSIQWMLPDQQGILCGTEKGEWLVQATTLNAPLTPTNIQAHQVTTIGSALAPTAQAIRCEHTVVFIQRYARRIMEYFADVFSGKFSAPNLAHLAQNTIGPGMDQIAYQQSLSPVVWARRTDGQLIGMSYKRQSLFASQGPEFYGWHQHTLGSGNTVTSIATGPSVDGTSDTLAMVTNDTFYNYVEFLTNFPQETDASDQAWMVDSGIVPLPQVITGNYVLGGLWRLAGLTVTVVSDGIDCGDWLVSATGTVTMPVAGSAFTLAGPNIVGFTYTSIGQLCQPVAPQESGSQRGPAFGKVKRLHRAAVGLVNAYGVSWGTSTGTQLYPILFNGQDGNAPIVAGQLFTGTYRDNIADDNSLFGQMKWQITRPYPCIITALSGAVETQDI